MDAVTEALNELEKLHVEDDAMEAAIEQEFAEILRSREQTVEAMRAWVDQLDPDEMAQKLAEFLAYRFASGCQSRIVDDWWGFVRNRMDKYAADSGTSAITSAARSNILRRRELAEQDGTREPIE